MDVNDDWVIVVPVDDEDYTKLLHAIWDDNRTHGTTYAPHYAGPRIAFTVRQDTAVRIGRGAVASSAPEGETADTADGAPQGDDPQEPADPDADAHPQAAKAPDAPKAPAPQEPPRAAQRGNARTSGRTNTGAKES